VPRFGWRRIARLRLLLSQDGQIVRGRGRLRDAARVAVDTSEDTLGFGFDYCVISTGSTPAIPGWAPVDGKRVLTTRQVYDMEEVPEHVVIVGSGVTGVEFTHIFQTLGSEVTLIVSRQQILPHRDPEVASALQSDYLKRGVKMAIGAYASAVQVTDDGVMVECDDGRRVRGSHMLLAVGSRPLTKGMGFGGSGSEPHQVRSHKCGRLSAHFGEKHLPGR